FLIIFLSFYIRNIIVYYEDILPYRLVSYFNIEKTRYSSEFVAYIIYITRILSIFSILISIRFCVNTSSSFYIRYDISILYILSIFSVLVSFNEILFERYYIFFVIFSVCISIRNLIDFRSLIIIAFIISLNTFMYGSYVQYVIFSDKYTDVIPNSKFKSD